MASVKATEKVDYLACKDPGDFFLSGQDGDPIRRMGFLCPCGCGLLAGILLGSTQENGCWKWNGSKEKPTTQPSINIMDKPNQSHWHGYLTNGEFVSC